MTMNLLIILILATLVSFVDTALMVLPSSQSPDSNCCVDVAEILARFHRQPDPRSNQHVIAVGPQSNTLLSSLDKLTFTAHDNESINSSDSGYFSFIRRYNADGIARFAVAGFKLLFRSC